MKTTKLNLAMLLILLFFSQIPPIRESELSRKNQSQELRNLETFFPPLVLKLRVAFP